jgi:hypothetical protein
VQVFKRPSIRPWIIGAKQSHEAVFHKDLCTKDYWAIGCAVVTLAQLRHALATRCVLMQMPNPK